MQLKFLGDLQQRILKECPQISPEILHNVKCFEQNLYVCVEIGGGDFKTLIN